MRNRISTALTAQLIFMPILLHHMQGLRLQCSLITDTLTVLGHLQFCLLRR